MKRIRLLLYPFAVIYNIITAIRNFLFDIGYLKSTFFDIPVIAVGNLSVGGTGKTPQIEYLTQLLKNTHKVAILSRGYKRKTKGFILVNDSHNAQDVGDEPLQLYEKFKDLVQVAVDANRVNGIQELLSVQNKPKVILLDDAYQHRRVRAKIYILLTKYDDLYSDDFVLPAGNLRECRRGANRADVVIVTKCPKNLSDDQINLVTKKLKLKLNQQLFFSFIQYNQYLKGPQKLTINDLKQKKVLLVTGIANSSHLVDYLNSLNLDFIHLKYPDHHYFSSYDVENIEKTFNSINFHDKVVLTTEKDYIRLRVKVSPLYQISIQSNFIKNADLFDKTILNVFN